MTWPTKKLGEVCILQNGFAFKSSEYVNTGFSVMRIANVQDGYISQADPKYIDKHRENEFSRFILNAGDILMSLTGNVGRVGVVEHYHLPAVLNQRVARIKPTEAIDNKYLYYLLLSPYFIGKVIGKGHGMAQMNVSTRDIGNFEIPLPPLEIQRKIVKKIEELFAKISQAQSLRESAARDLNNFVEASIHQALKKMPGWQEKEFGNIVEVDAKRNTKTDLPYVGMEDVSAGGTAEFHGSLKPKRVKSMTFHFDHNHILYGKLRPYLNKILVPQFEGHCTTEFLPLKPDGKLLIREWLALWLRSQETVNKIMTTTTGTRMPRADMKRVKDFIIPLPPLAEQKKIVEKMDALTQKVRELQKLQSETAANLTALKQSILHKAFQGELIN